MPRQCNKAVYRSSEAAARAAERRTRKAGDELRVYRCADCDHAWHITSRRERPYIGTPQPNDLDGEMLKRLRKAAKDRARQRLAPGIPFAEVEGWHFSTMHVSTHARRESLQRLARQDRVRLDGNTEAIEWVRPSDPVIDGMVHASLARRLQLLQQRVPGSALDVERWLAQWKTTSPDIPEALRRESLDRLAGRGLITIAHAGTPHATITHVKPMRPEDADA